MILYGHLLLNLTLTCYDNSSWISVTQITSGGEMVFWSLLSLLLYAVDTMYGAWIDESG